MSLFKRTVQISTNLCLLLGGAWAVHHYNRRQHKAFCVPCKGPIKTRYEDSIAAVSVANNKKVKLKQVHVYFRHGARTPLHLIPEIEQVYYPKGVVLKDAPHTVFKHQVVMLPDKTPRTFSEREEEYKKTQLKGGGYAGNLTVQGQEQLYVLGRKLRNAYVCRHKILEPHFKPSEIEVQSTNINRTIVSARCLLAGMFGKLELSESGRVQITVCQLKDDYLLPNDIACQRMKKSLDLLCGNPDKISNMNDRLLVQQALGYDEDTKMKLNLYFAWDDLVCRMEHGYTPPKAVIPYLDLIESNAVKMLYLSTCGATEAERPVITRLAVGRALWRLTELMKSVISGEKTAKMFLWSTHDTTIIALLEAMGVFDWKVPPFGADLRLELYGDDDGQHYVRVAYCSKDITLRNCSSPVITFEQFQTVLEPYIIDDLGFKNICSAELDNNAEEVESKLEAENTEVENNAEDETSSAVTKEESTTEAEPAEEESAAEAEPAEEESAAEAEHAEEESAAEAEPAEEESAAEAEPAEEESVAEAVPAEEESAAEAEPAEEESAAEAEPAEEESVAEAEPAEEESAAEAEPAEEESAAEAEPAEEESAAEAEPAEEESDAEKLAEEQASEALQEEARD